MSNSHHTVNHNRRAARQQKKVQQSNRLLAAALVLILGGLAVLVWMSVQTAVPTPTTNSYGAPALAQQGGTVTDFTIESLGGFPVSLNDYEGEVIIMNFWATWCPPCRAEMPGINNFYEAYKEEGLVVLAINEEESAETVRPFIELNNFTFPVLLDIEGRVAQQYSTRSFPTTFIIDRQGVIQHVQTGEISERELEKIVLPLLN
ncbi:MAG: TlpA family protein disulfide reductase [Anaerolineaceae bacterium]|nr:TlpA family protein disulfide reductase [Anaerolineaceae bacterium]